MIDGAVRELAEVTRSVGTLVRSVQTGLVRAYALDLGVRRGLFHRLLRAGGGRSCADARRSRAILLADRRRASCCSRCRATTATSRGRSARCVAAATFFMLLAAGNQAVERPLALAPVRRGVSLRCDAGLILARAADARFAPPARLPRSNFRGRARSSPLMLLLEGSMLGLFLARDLLVFALFWDLMLIPVFFGLVGWSAHPATAWRYLIYNFSGGLLLLLATAAFGVLYGSTDVIGRCACTSSAAWAPWIFAGFALAFLGQDAGLAAAHVDAADVRRPAAADGRGRLGRAVEGGSLRIHRHRAGAACRTICTSTPAS